jgi:hypothetical protein
LTKNNASELEKIIQDSFKSLEGIYPVGLRLSKVYIVRTRKNNEKTLFFFPSELSYRRDVSNIKTFQRATRPLHTTFYGTIGFSPDSKYHEAVGLTIMESPPEDTSVTHMYTSSVWELKEEIVCMSIINDSFKDSKSPIQQKLYKKYQESISKCDFRDEVVEFNSLLSHEFSKEVKKSGKITDKDSNYYQISGMIGSFFLVQGYGIIYPSVALKGFENAVNVALPWRFARNCLEIKKLELFRARFESKEGLKELHQIGTGKIKPVEINLHHEDRIVTSDHQEIEWYVPMKDDPKKTFYLR